MVDDLSALDELAANLRRFDRVGADIAADAAPGVQAAARATAAAGTDPYGTPWAATKKGSAPLQNAAGAISAVVSGTTTALIVLVLKGFYVFHDAGVKDGAPQRKILPDRAKGIPTKILDVIRTSARKIVAGTAAGAR